MSAPPLFPSLSALDIGVHKKPLFSTGIQRTASLRESRAVFASFPLYEFELVANGLNAASDYQGSMPPGEFQSTMGLFLNSLGMFGTFLFQDPDDCQVTGSILGVGDGDTTQFALVRSLGGWVEPVGWVKDTPTVRKNGTATLAFTLNAPNSITFTTAPASGVTITADFSFYFLCRFLEDQHDYLKLWDKMWSNESIKFTSVKT